MEESEKNKNILLWAVAGIFGLAASIIVIVFFIISRSQSQTDTELQVMPERDSHQVLITANPGGSIPTQVPTEVPDPLQGMDSPMLCKLELAGLHERAEKLGAGGILVLDSYNFGKNACIFDLKKMTAPGSLGKIEIYRNDDTGEYGITLKIDSKSEEALIKWGKAALLFLNSDITGEQAEASIRNALTEGTSDGILYSVKSGKDLLLNDGKAETVNVLEIQSRIDMDGN